MRRPVFLLSAAVLCLSATPPPAIAASQSDTVRSLTKQQARLGSASSAMVVDLRNRKTIYAFQAQKSLAPASNEKLFVTAGALLKFGPGATLDTTVAAAPKATLDRKGTLKGNLYLVGGGDPTLGDAGLTSLAKQVRRAGIKRVTGAIVGDESLLDRRRGGPDSGYRYDYDLSGALGALVWGHGSSAGGGPALTAVKRFGARLKAAGVRYGRAPRVGVLPGSSTTGGADAGAGPIAISRSRPIRELIRAVNVPSENFYAEMMTKVLGARFGRSGSTRSGLAVVSTAIAPFSIAPKLRDGSGLSRANQTSAYAITTLLAGMHVSEVADEYRASLPVAGLSGTLASRMRGTAAAGRCRAKTGTLNGVSALSGYCITKGGRNIAFSLIENRVCSGCAKAVEDRMVATLARLN